MKHVELPGGWAVEGYRTRHRGPFREPGGANAMMDYDAMAVKLNDRAYEYAKQLVKDRRVVLDERDDWSEHQPTAAKENKFIQEHGFREYARWHLGIDDTEPEEAKGRYKFPYGDFAEVHRCAVLAAESRAGQYKYVDIEMAAAHLHGMLDALR